MNLANKITVSRLFLVVAMIVLVLICSGDSSLANYGWAKIVAGGIFLVAALTDFLDGHIARSKNMVTTFGKFLDPIADKVLINSTFILFTAEIFPNIRLSVIITIIMVARDIIVDAIRMIAVEKQVVIAASKWGKLKTVMQIVALGTLFFIPVKYIDVGYVLAWVAAAVSLLSGIDYFWKNRKIVLEGIR